MSFLSERKDEIIQQQIKGQCCKRALLCGVLFAKASFEEGRISLNVENIKIANYISGIINELFQKNTTIGHSERGGRCIKISFYSTFCEKYLNSILNDEAAFLIEKCSGCKAAFIKGLFLSCGRIVNPQKQYRLELSPAFRTEKIIDFFEENGVRFSFKKRRNENIIYTANSTVLEDFLHLRA